MEDFYSLVNHIHPLTTPFDGWNSDSAKYYDAINYCNSHLPINLAFNCSYYSRISEKFTLTKVNCTKKLSDFL